RPHGTGGRAHAGGADSASSQDGDAPRDDGSFLPGGIRARRTARAVAPRLQPVVRFFLCPETMTTRRRSSVGSRPWPGVTVAGACLVAHVLSMGGWGCAARKKQFEDW